MLFVVVFLMEMETGSQNLKTFGTGGIQTTEEGVVTLRMQVPSEIVMTETQGMDQPMKQ